MEAVPSAFLGVMLLDPAVVAGRRGDRSDVFFRIARKAGRFRLSWPTSAPGRDLSVPLDNVRNHDDRAALVCALTALSVAAGEFTAVGDADGWIVLPCFVRDWAWADLEAGAGARYRTACTKPPGPLRPSAT